MNAAAFCDECGAALNGAVMCPSCGTGVTTPPTPDRRTTMVRRARATRRSLGAVARHNRAGSLAGLAAAWFNIPLVLLMAAAGAFFGGVVGLFSGGFGGPGALDRFGAVFSLLVPMPVDVQDLLPTAAVQVGGIIGALLGIVTGGLKMAWLTFAGFWEILYAGDPLWPLAVLLGQIVTALFVGALYTLYSARTEAWRLRLAGGRRPSRREAAEQIEAHLDECAQAETLAPPGCALGVESTPTRSTDEVSWEILEMPEIGLVASDEEALHGDPLEVQTTTPGTAEAEWSYSYPDDEEPQNETVEITVGGTVTVDEGGTPVWNP